MARLVALVVAATTTVASTVLAIAAMIATLSLTLATIARGTRHIRGVVGVERLRGRCGHVGAEREFLQDQVIPDLVEGREWHAMRDDDSKMIVPLV
jgi:hypothetical protein